MNLVEGTTYEFRVTAENKAGRSDASPSSQPIVVRELTTGNSPRFVEQLSDVYVAEGQIATLSCVVKGSPDPDCAWYVMFTSGHVTLNISKRCALNHLS